MACETWHLDLTSSGYGNKNRDTDTHIENLWAGE